MSMRLPPWLARWVGAIAVTDAWTSLSPHARGFVLCTYYVGVVITLLMMYGTNPPSPPPFIYQGF